MAVLRLKQSVGDQTRLCGYVPTLLKELEHVCTTVQNYYIFVTVTSMRREMFGIMISSTSEKATTVVVGMKAGKHDG
jgi:hypothetical protein